MVKLPHFDADGNRVRIGGAGCLTKDCIDKLQEYYSLAIKRNTNDLQAMTDAVMAVPTTQSTDGDPQHQYHRTGPSSWCKYQ